MLFSLAFVPVIVILVYIYKKDKKEKEPMGLLIGLFFAGMGTILKSELPFYICVAHDRIIKNRNLSWGK